MTSSATAASLRLAVATALFALVGGDPPLQIKVIKTFQTGTDLFVLPTFLFDSGDPETNLGIWGFSVVLPTHSSRVWESGHASYNAQPLYMAPSVLVFSRHQNI